MKNLPNFLIIGPPKCASTSLHYYLGQHPDVFVSPTKETNFFTHDYYRGLEFYAQYFSNAKTEKAIGEATPSYFFLPFAADRIKKDLPNAKLIVTLRNPVERAFSHWLMFKEAGVEKKSFRDAIKINLEQMQEYNFEGEKGAEIWEKRKNTADDNDNWPRIYIQPGMYAESLNMYYESFKPEQMHIVFLEDLKKIFSETIKEVFRFLNVDENFMVENTEAKNFYFDKKYFRFLQKLTGIKTARYISGILPSNLKNIFKQKQTAVKVIPKISDEDRAFLQDLFLPDIRQLEKITNRSLENWVNH
ncbi:MAG: sulfotransferase [Parafilimonas sp.]